MRALPSSLALAIWAVSLGTTLLAADASAQNPQATVMQLNQQAMAAYGNLQFAQAMQILQQAEATCRQYNLGGVALARTYLNMGVVEVGGNQNNAAGLEHFKKALCTDSTVMLDPLSSTPEIETLFNLARSQAAAPGACQQATPPPPPPGYPPPPPPGYPPQQPPPTMQLLRHTQVTQQLRLVPIPIYTDVNPNVSVGQVILFYRTIGERIFQQVPMQRHGQGFAASIGCDVLQTFDPTGIEYYIAVLDPNNQLLGTSGSEAQPHQTSIVQTLTVPSPALPNAAPPAKCMEECPPWNPDCNKACKQMGDLCDSSAECCMGMVCLDEMCTPSEGDGGPEGELDPIFRMSVNFGTGVGLVGGGEAKPYNQTSQGSLSIGTGFTWSKLHFRINPMFYLPIEGLSIGVMFRGSLPMEPNYPDDVLPVGPAGLVAVGYRLVGEEEPSGFQLHFLGGLGGGMIYHRVPYKDCKAYEIEYAEDDEDTEDSDHPWYDDVFSNDNDDGDTAEVCSENAIDDSGNWDASDQEATTYFRRAGLFVAELGIDGYYWFVPAFGLNFGLLVDILAPDFALNFDVQIGIALRF